MKYGGLLASVSWRRLELFGLAVAGVLVTVPVYSRKWTLALWLETH